MDCSSFLELAGLASKVRRPDSEVQSEHHLAMAGNHESQKFPGVHINS